MAYLLDRLRWFQSLSGLSLGLNNQYVKIPSGNFTCVSIPFRAVTGFERILVIFESRGNILFQSLSGLSLGLNQVLDLKSSCAIQWFQSLSGLSLGLNIAGMMTMTTIISSFNPFQGCHWV